MAANMSGGGGLPSSSSQQAPVMTNEIRIGNKYRLGKKIGAGSFGDIYLGKLYWHNISFLNSFPPLRSSFHFIRHQYRKWRTSRH